MVLWTRFALDSPPRFVGRYLEHSSLFLWSSSVVRCLVTRQCSIMEMFGGLP